jgi:microcystin synthetase protein McyD
MLLEVSWQAIEDAGINPQSMEDSNAGVFVGAWTQEYKNLFIGDKKNQFRIYMGSSFGTSWNILQIFYVH